MAKFFGIFIALFAVGCYAAQKMTFTANENVMPGEQIQFTCRVDGLEMGMYVEWYKYDSNGKSLRLSTNKNPEPVVTQQLPSFNFSAIQHVDHPSTIDFVLVVRNAQVKYSGRYGCRLITGGTNVEKFVYLNVLVAPTTIQLKIDDVVVAEDQSVEVEDGDRRHIVCEASGGNPAPRLEVIKGTRRITEQFSSLPQVRYSASTPNTFEIPNGHTIMETDIVLNSGDANKPIICQAFVEGLEDAAIETPSYTVTFAGVAPEISCGKPTVVKIPYETDVILNCTVISTLEMEKVQLEFTTGLYDNRTRILFDGDKFGRNMQFVTQQDEHSPEKKHLILKLERVYPQMFRTFTFRAANSFGESHANITLERNSKYRYVVDPRNGSGIVKYGSSGLISAILAFVFLCHI